MYRAEAAAVASGTTFTELMERAGRTCAGIIRDEYCKDGKKNILIISGKGKNGGDGFVIARYLTEWGHNVSILLACGKPAGGDEKDNFSLLEIAGANITEYTGDTAALSAKLKEADVTVDAVFGTGFRGRLDRPLEEMARYVNAISKKTVSIDVPSGVDCDTGISEGEIFLPDMTIAISAFKPVHVTKPFCAVCKRIRVADIGIKDSDFESIGEPMCHTLECGEIGTLLPQRRSNSNKGTYGHAVCIGGSYRMPGAEYMCVSGAVRTGAGLVTAAFPKSAYPALASRITEAINLPLEDNFDGTFAFSSLATLSDYVNKCAAALIGCGMGYNLDTERLTEGFLKAVRVPLVIDADALNVIGKNPDILRDTLVPCVLTPHPGEMSRLCGKSIKDILLDPVNTAREFSMKYNCITVLKTANTIVCSEDGSRIYFNRTGNSGLSKGGSGDLLAGMIVSLIAQGVKPYDAAVAGVYMHGDCADFVAAKTSQRGMTVSDMIAALPEYYGKFEK